MKRRVYSNTLRSSAARTSVVLAFGLLPIGASIAQNEDAATLADLKACAAIERNNARLACYDGVLGRPSAPLPSAAEGAGAPAAVPPTAAAVVPPAAAVVPPAATVAPPAAPAVAPPAAATAPVEEPSAAPSQQTIVVTEVHLRTPTYAIFITDNGQTWEQTSGGRGRYPEVPFEATLEAGSLGSTFLISPAGGPRIRVRLRN